MGQIDADTYIELSPKSIMPFKEQLRRRMEETARRKSEEEVNADALPKL